MDTVSKNWKNLLLMTILALSAVFAAVGVGSGRLTAYTGNSEGYPEILPEEIHASNDGSITRKGDSGNQAGGISLVSATSHGSNRVVTSIRTKEGTLKLVNWAINADGSITRKGDSGNQAGGISLVSATSHGSNRVVTSIRTKEGTLKLVNWAIKAFADEGLRERNALYNMPFLGEHFDEGDLKIYWHRAKHGDSGVQEHGYDLGAVRYDDDPQAKKWTELTVSDAEYNQDKTNNRWLIYKKPVHAMRDGKVIACWRNAPENPPGDLHPKVGEGFVYGGGNGYWIEHSDGTRAEYAHMIPGSVPRDLCPHNDVLLPGKIASPRVEDAWPQIRVPSDKQVTVKQGQFLGEVGNTGTSSNPHLHIHVEQGGTATDVKSGGTPVQINFQRGLSAPRNDANPDSSWKTFAGKPIPPGPVLVWPPVSLTPEYARHGFDPEEFSRLFLHLKDSGYQPVWFDGYRVGEKVFYNFIWRPSTTGWRMFRGLTSTEYQQKVEQALEDDLSPQHVESYLNPDGSVRYAVIFIKDGEKNLVARHGITLNAHRDVMNTARQMGLSPVSVSVVSISGDPRYTVLYRPKDIGEWQIHSRIPVEEFQQVFDEMKGKGMAPHYVAAYSHEGRFFYSVVFASKNNVGRVTRHGMDSPGYQETWKENLGKGKLTQAVTGYDGSIDKHLYVGIWQKGSPKLAIQTPLAN